MDKLVVTAIGISRRLFYPLNCQLLLLNLYSFSAGDSFESALDSVVEAIDLHLEGLAEEGAETPLPRSIAYHQGNPDFADGVWALVDVDVAKY